MKKLINPFKKIAGVAGKVINVIPGGKEIVSNLIEKIPGGKVITHLDDYK